MSVRIAFRPAVLGLILLASATLPLRAQPAAAGEPTRTERFLRWADRLLSAGQDAARSAESIAREAAAELKKAAGDADAAVRRSIDSAIADARQKYEASLGLFALNDTDGFAGGIVWTPVSDDRPLNAPRVVVLIHGLAEPGDIWDDLAPALRAAGHRVVRFNYRNSQPATRSADDLAAALANLRARHGVRTVDLVGHSLGGLIARDLLTRPAHYAGRAAGHGSLPDVARLVTIGTPNQGAPLAELAALGRVRQHFSRWLASDGQDPAMLLGFIADGDGQAGRDLIPGSPYLTDLNSRPMPSGVRITVLIGRLADGAAAELAPLLDIPWIADRLGPERARLLRDQLGRASEAVGDGIVPDSSAQLPGAAGAENVRTVTVDANHRTLVNRLTLVDAARRAAGRPADEPPGIRVILDALADR
ncbi:MAG: alpha/beta fold hydrolase [Phycisphaerales bacterium]|nr:alpha/beta fold hydrolase [Phycisphaerales bacterium]